MISGNDIYTPKKMSHWVKYEIQLDTAYQKQNENANKQE